MTEENTEENEELPSRTIVIKERPKIFFEAINHKLTEAIGVDEDTGEKFLVRIITDNG